MAASRARRAIWPAAIFTLTEEKGSIKLAMGGCRAQDKIPRRGDFFFVAFVCFCKPLSAKQKATKATKWEKTLQTIWLYLMPP